MNEVVLYVIKSGDEFVGLPYSSEAKAKASGYFDKQSVIIRMTGTLPEAKITRAHDRELIACNERQIKAEWDAYKARKG